MTRTTVTSDMSQLLWNKLEQTVRDNNLEKFYTPERLRQVHNLVQSVNWDSLAQRWKISKELAMDFAALALYDIVLYIDDSGSMAVEEGGDRIEDAKLYCSKISEIATLFDDDGILVRFINSNIEGNGIRNANEVNNLFSQIRFSGGTALGTMLEQKIIRPLVTSQTTLNKPILVVTITDGEPSGEPKNKLEVVISETVRFCDKKYGRHAVSFMFAQVGKDMRAQQFLSEIDENKYFGDVVDTVSYYELESMKLEKHGITLTPETFLLKLILGAVDKSYDMDV
jgi:hypothetical protein